MSTNLLMPVINNPVKLAALSYISLKWDLEEIQTHIKLIEKYTKKFTPEQLQQYVMLINGVIPWDQVPDYLQNKGEVDRV